MWSAQAIFELCVLVAWSICGIAVLLGTVNGFRAAINRDELALLGRITISFAAFLPGLLLLAELTVRCLVPRVMGHPQTPVYDLASLAPVLVWIVVGPLLFLSNLLLGKRAPAPPSAVVVLMGHVTFWILSTVTALVFAVKV